MTDHTRPLRRVLIANRGEIARRIARTCRARGIATVAVYSDADQEAAHVAGCDAAVRLGPAPAAESYLRSDAVISAAQTSGADAVHPGYGFLSERADFARAVIDAGLTWIGPAPAAIQTMGDKAAARRAMAAAGVPVVPGYDGAAQDDAALLAAAHAVGFPLMVKAAAGGGGKGMRQVTQADALPEALDLARGEAARAFGDAKLILERLITGARHVEVQVIGDAYGSVIHLGERDCSAQRRHQKVIEEAPSPAVDPVLRARMGAAAVAAAQAVGYQGAGTVEFLLEPSGAFYFLEMNTRLQVEHPVTEAVTGLDLVGLQLDLAAGAPLPLTQDDVALNGHALEVRLYAEDPGAGFLPSAGPLLSWDMPDDLRVEAGYRAGDTVSPHYDAMLAKIIAWGDTRAVALARLRAGLERLSCLGLPTNRGHLLEILDHPDFIAGAATTDWLETEVPGAAPAARSADVALAAAAWLNTEAARLARIGRINPALRGFGAPGSHLTLAQGDHRWDLFARPVPKGWYITGKGFAHQVTGMPPTMAVDGCRRAVAYAAQGDQLWLAHDARDMAFRRVWATPEAIAGPDTGRIIAPMAGALVALDVAPGDRVDADDRVAVIEAMKMSHALRAGRAGIVTQVGAALGDQVAQGAAIVTLAAQDADQEENADNADTG